MVNLLVNNICFLIYNVDVDVESTSDVDVGDGDINDGDGNSTGVEWGWTGAKIRLHSICHHFPEHEILFKHKQYQLDRERWNTKNCMESSKLRVKKWKC